LKKEIEPLKTENDDVVKTYPLALPGEPPRIIHGLGAAVSQRGNDWK
jgi:hypothetical protein